jgi:hypothetical protein
MNFATEAMPIDSENRYCPEKVCMKISQGFHLSGNNDKPFSDENPKI